MRSICRGAPQDAPPGSGQRRPRGSAAARTALAEWNLFTGTGRPLASARTLAEMGDETIEGIALPNSQTHTHENPSTGDGGSRRSLIVSPRILHLADPRRFGKLEDGKLGDEVNPTAPAATGESGTLVCAYQKMLLLALAGAAVVFNLVSAPVVILSVVMMVAALTMRIAYPPNSMAQAEASFCCGVTAFAVLPLLALVHLVRLAFIVVGTRPNVGWVFVLLLTLGRSMLYSGVALRLARARAHAAYFPAPAQMQMNWTAMRDVLSADLCYTWASLAMIGIIQPSYGGSVLGAGLWGILTLADPSSTDPTGCNIPLLLQLCGVLCAHALSQDAMSGQLPHTTTEAAFSTYTEGPLVFERLAPNPCSVKRRNGAIVVAGHSCLTGCGFFVASILVIVGLLKVGVAGGFNATWHQVQYLINDAAAAGHMRSLFDQRSAAHFAAAAAYYEQERPLVLQSARNFTLDWYWMRTAELVDAPVDSFYMMIWKRSEAMLKQLYEHGRQVKRHTQSTYTAPTVRQPTMCVQPRPATSRNHIGIVQTYIHHTNIAAPHTANMIREIPCHRHRTIGSRRTSATCITGSRSRASPSPLCWAHGATASIFLHGWSRLLPRRGRWRRRRTWWVAQLHGLSSSRCAI